MASVAFVGLTELQTALLRLPEHLAEEAAEIVDDAAERAMASAFQGYARRTGNLRRGLKKEQKFIGRYGAAVVVKNTAKHAWIYENGTQARHTRIGANRGVMPPGHAFIPAAERSRARMYRELSDMLVREGFLVSGHAP